MRTIGVLVAVHKDFGLVWMTGQHQCLPGCKMLCDQYVFDVLKYRVEVDEDGSRRYYNSAELLHRDDGPAIERANGTKYWYQNGKWHRTDGPAIEYADGCNIWYQNGDLHRTDGPAIEWANGGKAWYINGRTMTEAEFKLAVKNYE